MTKAKEKRGRRIRNIKKPPLCKGRWHFRKKMTEGLWKLVL